MENEQYMVQALALAREAGEGGDVPVGCVIADSEGNIIGRGRNRREADSDATAHAEIEAIAWPAPRADAGGWTDARCSSRWSRARCAQAQF